jgi:uncharacterized membrane protein
LSFAYFCEVYEPLIKHELPMKKLSIFIVLLIFVVVSCQKEQYKIEIVEEETSLSVEEIVQLTNQEFLQTPESTADENREFFTENDGLIDTYTATEAAFDEKSLNNSFIRCLSGVGLDAEQSAQTRRALRAFEQRNERIIASHRQAVRQLSARANNARLDLLNQFQQGEIDRPELARRLNQLRENYRTALHELKESNAEAFSRSFHALMVNLHDIMTNRQWAAFTECLRTS